MKLTAKDMNKKGSAFVPVTNIRLDWKNKRANTLAY
jgi:hypothetical protein